MVKIECITPIREDGKQYVILFAEEPTVNNYDLWEGGKCLEFELDNVKQITNVYKFHWSHGCHAGETLVKKFKENILGTSEMLKFAENFKWEAGDSK